MPIIIQQLTMACCSLRPIIVGAIAGAFGIGMAMGIGIVMGPGAMAMLLPIICIRVLSRACARLRQPSTARQMSANIDLAIAPNGGDSRYGWMTVTSARCYPSNPTVSFRRCGLLCRGMSYSAG